jgi:hypothetical protein
MLGDKLRVQMAVRELRFAKIAGVAQSPAHAEKWQKAILSRRAQFTRICPGTLGGS